MEYFVLFSIVILVIVLNKNIFKPSVVFLACVSVFCLLDLINIKELLSNFVNPSLINLILLLIIATVISKTNLATLIKNINEKKKLDVLKISLFSGILSAFVNNTLVISIAIKSLHKKNNMSKLLLPISYIAILGGTVTLIGTSTNLILNGLVVKTGMEPINIFDFAYVGIPILVVGIIYVCLFSYKLLPLNNNVNGKENGNYFLEAKVLENSNLIGKSISKNKLRNLENIYLAEIIRNNKLISPVKPDEIIEENDTLVFAGDIDKIKDLQKFDKLKVFGEKNSILDSNLIWSVLSHNSSLLGHTIKEACFRSKFDASVVAVKRGAKKLSGKIGSIKLKAGDYLVLAIGDDFYKKEGLDEHFYVYNNLDVQEYFSTAKSLITIITFILAIVLSAMGFISLFKALIILLFLYLLLKLTSPNEVKDSFNIELLVLVGSALGISKVLIDSGAAKLVSDSIIYVFNNFGVFGSFIGIYLLTVIFTQIITNNAAAVLVFPIAYSTAITLNVSPLPFIMAVAYGASANFITPYGYHANLLVFSTGIYKPLDFFKFGFPLLIIYSILVLTLIPVFFKF